MANPMNIAGNCPSCGKPAQVQYRPVTASEHFGAGKLTCVSYSCSACQAILGVEVDPYALMTDLTERVAKRLGAKGR